MKKRLAQMEQEQQREVEAFLESHPEFDGEFERGERERRWVAGRNLTTYPIDPHLLSEVGENYHRGAAGVAGGAEEGQESAGDLEYSDAALSFQNLWPGSTPRTVEQEQLAARVADALDKLPHIDRTVLERRYMERMTLDAIAEEEDVSRQAVLKRLERATRHFKEVFDGPSVP